MYLRITGSAKSAKKLVQITNLQIANKIRSAQNKSQIFTFFVNLTNFVSPQFCGLQKLFADCLPTSVVWLPKTTHMVFMCSHKTMHKALAFILPNCGISTSLCDKKIQMFQCSFFCRILHL
jgi:hypothetical protein